MSNKKPVKRRVVRGGSSVDARQNKEIAGLKKKMKELTSPDNNKFLDTTIYGPVTTITQTSIVNNVLPVNFDGTVTSASTSLTQRKGKRITLKSLHIRGTIFNASDSTNPDDYATVRMLVVRFPDNAISSSTPMSAVLLPQVGGLSTILYAHKDRLPRNPYDIMYDRTFNLQASYQSNAQSTPTEPWRYNLNKHIYFKGKEQDCRWPDVESVSSPSNNSVCIMLISDSSAISHPYSNLNCRLHFQDN